MTEEEMYEIARGNIECNLADAVDEDGPDTIYDNSYVLAFDALADAGVPHDKARNIAQAVAQSFAQP